MHAAGVSLWPRLGWPLLSASNLARLGVLSRCLELNLVQVGCLQHPPRPTAAVGCQLDPPLHLCLWPAIPNCLSPHGSCSPNDDGRMIAREILHHEVGRTHAAGRAGPGVAAAAVLHAWPTFVPISSSTGAAPP